ncbi:MAG: hypothetical protein LLG02_03345, partial [Pelosinus sp.]|nr:hypothetical protein [Pelosinus sp.]
VCCCREIAAGFVDASGSRAKVSVCCVMLVRSRKIAYRYVRMGIGCSVDHYGLFHLLSKTMLAFFLL